MKKLEHVVVVSLCTNKIVKMQKRGTNWKCGSKL